MEWWRDAKFGMFIHWGVYAVPSGRYQGAESKYSEFIMKRARIPVGRYRDFAKQFNPVQYDPDAWARIARDAGMRYVVITSKHIDGFALFPSDVTDWDIKDATPYGKDLIAPLATAVRRHGLKFGLYYSQAQDWVNAGGSKGKASMQEGKGWDLAQTGSFDAYLEHIAQPQVREILTRYRPDILWWDAPVSMTSTRAALLHNLIALRPGLITNNRLGGGYQGDFMTPEQRIPAAGYADRDWETCMTMNDSWGYKKNDNHWKSTATLVHNLVDVVSKGGNYLLNIGPTAEGEIPQPSVERLEQIGAWMKVNGEAIYGTRTCPFSTPPAWGRCTAKVSLDGSTTLYLHVFTWPGDGKLLVSGLRSPVVSASLLATGAHVASASNASGVILDLPANPPDPISSTVVVKVKGISAASPDFRATIPRAPDPSVIAASPNDGGGYYAFATGPGIPILHSTDLVRWQRAGRVFGEPVPAWATQAILKDTRMTWGPDISYHNGLYHLYYAASSPRSQRSVIGLAVNRSIRPGDPRNRWEDRGPVVTSVPGQKYNAIAPTLFVDRDGQWYLFFGAGQRLGIWMVKIDPRTGKAFPGDMVKVAGRPPLAGNIEAPHVVLHGEFYYLFVSWDACCRQADSDYKIVVGRAGHVYGPYVDDKGRNLLDGGGTLLLEGDAKWRGPGSSSVLSTPQAQWMVYEAWDTDHIGAGRILQLRSLSWTKDGWPRLGRPLSANLSNEP